jgi:UDP-N-acetylglucosamine 4,6-dehydratase
MITGGAGSFGKKFVKTLCRRFDPARVVVYSRDEWKHSELQNEFDSPALRLFIGDVRDADRLQQAMRGVDIVIHAAAMKQVPAAEYNPMECIKTNVHGAENVISAALANDVQRVIAISTDKASSPVNLYGASKLASDKLFVAANNISGGHPTRFSVVRYGNVVGSRGSVVPFFKRLHAEGRPLPVTDERMSRFWITLQQGVDFVLTCFNRMQGGEIFVPKIPSMRIMDLVASINPAARTEKIGIRPGEKLHELLCSQDDSHLILEFEDHYVVRPGLRFYDQDVDYRTNPLGEEGSPVDEGWEYNSKDNPHFLTVDELRMLNRESEG